MHQGELMRREDKQGNYYDNLFNRLIDDGLPLPCVIEEVASAYLDGKPLRSGKHKFSKRDRNGLFWSSQVARACTHADWESEAMSLALAQYLAQDDVSADGLTTRVAREAPETLVRAVRYSSLVLRPTSPRRAELEQSVPSVSSR